MIRYRFRQVDKAGNLWLSPDVFEAPTLRQVWQGVLGGFIMGHARSAETEDGKPICGLDAKGKEIRI